MKLEVPSATINVSGSGVAGKAAGRGSRALSVMATDWRPVPTPPPGSAAPLPGQPRVPPSPLPPAWHVPSGASAEVLRLSFKPDAPGVYEGHIHLHMTSGECSRVHAKMHVIAIPIVLRIASCFAPKSCCPRNIKAASSIFF